MEDLKVKYQEQKYCPKSEAGGGEQRVGEPLVREEMKGTGQTQAEKTHRMAQSETARRLEVTPLRERTEEGYGSFQRTAQT